MSGTRSRSASIPTAAKSQRDARVPGAEKFMLWRDLFEKSTKDAAGFFKTDDGVFYYGKRRSSAGSKGLEALLRSTE